MMRLYCSGPVECIYREGIYSIRYYIFIFKRASVKGLLIEAADDALLFQ